MELGSQIVVSFQSSELSKFLEMEKEKENCSLTVPSVNLRARVARWVIKHDVFCTTVIIFLFLLINSIVTISRSIHEPSTVAFVVFCNLDILVLHLCMSQFENASAKWKGVLKASIWILATLLTLAVCHRVTGIMPPVIAGIIWGLAAVNISGSFYALFVYDDVGSNAEGKADDRQPC